MLGSGSGRRRVARLELGSPSSCSARARVGVELLSSGSRESCTARVGLELLGSSSGGHRVAQLELGWTLSCSARAWVGIKLLGWASSCSRLGLGWASSCSTLGLGWTSSCSAWAWVGNSPSSRLRASRSPGLAATSRFALARPCGHFALRARQPSFPPSLPLLGHGRRRAALAAGLARHTAEALAAACLEHE